MTKGFALPILLLAIGIIVGIFAVAANQSPTIKNMIANLTQKNTDKASPSSTNEPTSQPDTTLNAIPTPSATSTPTPKPTVKTPFVKVTSDGWAVTARANESINITSSSQGFTYALGSAPLPAGVTMTVANAVANSSATLHTNSSVKPGKYTFNQPITITTPTKSNNLFLHIDLTILVSE